MTPGTEHQLWGVPAVSYSDLDLVTPACLWPTGASWRSPARWRCRSPPASSRCSPTTPPPPCSPSSWRTPAGWSRSCPTSSFCTGERHRVVLEGGGQEGQEAAMGEARRRERPCLCQARGNSISDVTRGCRWAVRGEYIPPSAEQQLVSSETLRTRASLRRRMALCTFLHRFSSC